MLALTDAQKNALRGDVRLGVFCRMDWTPDPIRVWLGIGKCRVGINALDQAAAIYNGFGELRDVPPVQMLINGKADRVTFDVSGVSASTAALATDEAPLVQGQAFAMGIGMFDQAWQQLGVPVWLFRGRADVVQLDWAPGDDGGIVRALKLSVGSLFTGRRRRGLSFLTDADQQARSPGDKFCERTVLYSQETDKRWPHFT